MSRQPTQSDRPGSSGYPILPDLSDDEDQYETPSRKKQKESIYATNERVDAAIADVRAEVRALSSVFVEKFDEIFGRMDNMNSKIDSLTENQHVMSRKIDTLTESQRTTDGYLDYQRQRLRVPAGRSLNNESDWAYYFRQRTESPENRDRQPLRSQAPPRERQQREPTVESARSNNTSDTNRTIKLSKIGVFNPRQIDDEDLGVVLDSKTTIYTDVNLFAERVKTFLESDDQYNTKRLQITDDFESLLGGSGLYWWTNELVVSERKELREEGIEIMLSRIQQRFKPDVGTATRRFNEGRLTVKDVARDNNAVAAFVQKKLRYARAAQMLAPDNANWAGIMSMIYNQIDMEIKHFLRAPDSGDTLEEYMKIIEKSKALLYSQADNQYPYLTRKSNWSNQQYDSSTRNDQNRDKYDRSQPYQNRNKRPTATFEKYNNRDRRDRDFKGRDREPYEKRQSNDREYTRDRSRERRPEGDRARGDKPIIANGRSDYHLRKPKSNDRAHLVESSEEAADETSSQQSKSDTQSEAGHFVGEKVVSEEEHKRQRTCRRCHSLFESRNRLFAHIPLCPVQRINRVTEEPQRQTSTAVPSTAVPSTAVPSTEAGERKIIAEDVQSDSTTFLEGNFLHMKLNITATPDGEKHEICIDTGTGRDTVDRAFLKHFEHKISTDRRGVSLKGINGPSQKLTEWAEWSFYVNATEPDGSAITIKMSANAWVVDTLDANCLLGNGWLNPRHTLIDTGNPALIFPKIAKGARVKTEVFKPIRPVVRKVNLCKAVVLQPGESKLVAIDYVRIPRGRSFMFSSTHPAVMNAMVDSQTPYSCIVANLTTETIRLKRRARIGTIHECNADESYFVTDVTNALSAVTVGAALGLSHFPTADTSCHVATTQLTLPSFSNSLVPAVSGEVTLTPELRQVASGSLQHREQAQTSSTLQTESRTPFSDLVYHLTQETPATDSQDTPPTDSKPCLKEHSSTFTIQDLATTQTSRQRPHTAQDNEVVVTSSKPGSPFRLVVSLLYNRDADGKERLVIPEAHDNKHHFGHDPKFTSEFWTTLWKAFRTRLMMTTAWHPQSDGQSEVKNKIAELAIRYHVYEKPDELWVDIIPTLQWNLNHAYSRIINTSPHEYLFGFKISGPLDRLVQADTPAKDVRFLRHAVRHDAQFAMDIAAAEAKKHYDSQHRQVEFQKDDQWKTVKELKHTKELIKEYMERMKVTKQLRGKKA